MQRQPLKVSIIVISRPYSDWSSLTSGAVNVDEQEDNLKHKKERCDIDDEDEVQEITAARTPIKKEQTRLCYIYSNICNEKQVDKLYPGRAQ